MYSQNFSFCLSYVFDQGIKKVTELANMRKSICPERSLKTTGCSSTEQRLGSRSRQPTATVTTPEDVFLKMANRENIPQREEKEGMLTNHIMIDYIISFFTSFG